MIGTEEQARKGWWCPEARVLAIGAEVTRMDEVPQAVAAAVNREAYEESCRCLGTGCAKWRWFGWRNKEGATYTKLPSRGPDPGWMPIGYCGAGGPP